MKKVYQINGIPFELLVGDITRLSTTAIANAANRSLVGGGGVDGAIHRAAGPELLRACRRITEELPDGRLRTGDAVLTEGFNLPAQYVIHCFGPVYRQARSEAPRLLALCYRNAIALCQEHDIDSIAFPSISTGVYGYPIEQAARIALETTRNALTDTSHPNHVVFCLFTEEDFEVYASTADHLFASRS